MRTSWVVRALISASYPGAMMATIQGAAATATAMTRAERRSRRPSTPCASRRADPASPSSTSEEKTGTKDADNAPSLNRLRNTFGTRSAVT